MKFQILLLAFIISPFFALSQDTTELKNIFTVKQHFEVRLTHGFSRAQVLSATGPVRPFGINGKIFDAAFGFTYNISSRIGISGQAKLGAYPLMLGIPYTEYSSGMDRGEYFRNASYVPFAELSARVSFRHFINNKLVITNSGGFGAKYIRETGNHSHQFQIDGSNVKSDYFFYNSGTPKPFLVLNPSLQFRLKNLDLLGVQLSYYYSLADILAGNYRIGSNSPAFSQGTYRLSGNELSIGLSYTFTGYEKKLSVAAARIQNKNNDLSKKEIKVQQRKEYFSSRMGKGSAIRVYAGIFRDRNIVADKGLTFTGTVSPSAGYGVEFFRDFRPGLFWEAAFNSHQYYSGYRYSYYGDFSGSDHNAFRAVKVSAGMGYIIRNKNSIPRLCISAGAAVGIVKHTTAGAGTIGGFWLTDNGVAVLQMYHQDFLLRKVFPLLYAGFRKDIRIRGRVYISPALRYELGLIKVYESKLNYMENSISPEIHHTSIFLRGGSKLLSLGLKVDL